MTAVATATATREPQRAGALADRLHAILSDRGIDPDAATAKEPPSEPVTALELADARIPARYRRALADHPQITAWWTRSPAPGARGLVGRPASRRARRC